MALGWLVAGIRLKMVHRTVLLKYIYVDIYTLKDIHEKYKLHETKRNNVHRHMIV